MQNIVNSAGAMKAGGQTSSCERPMPPATVKEAGVGATEEFSLRVSTAVLGRVHFRDPVRGEEMLVLERKCTREIKETGEKKTSLNAQPPGGASVLKNPTALMALTGGFNYDSEKSRKEGDFRVQIRPTDWPSVRDFCVENFSNPALGAVEADIDRELHEELEEALKIKMKDGAYVVRNAGVEIQEEASSTERMGVSGAATCRVFNVKDVEITDPELIQAILENSAAVGNETLIDAAETKASRSAKRQGKVTALLALDRLAVEQAFETGAEKVKVGPHKLIPTVGIALKCGQ